MEILPTDTSRTVLQAREQFAAGKKLAEAPMPFSQARTMFAGGTNYGSFLSGIQEKTAYVQQQKKYGEQLKAAESEFETQVKEVEKQYLEYLKTPAGVMEYAREKGVAPVISQKTAKVGDQFITVPVRTYVTPYGSYTEEAEYQAAVGEAKGTESLKAILPEPKTQQESQAQFEQIFSLARKSGMSIGQAANVVTGFQSNFQFEQTLKNLKEVGFKPIVEAGTEGGRILTGFEDPKANYSFSFMQGKDAQGEDKKINFNTLPESTSLGISKFIVLQAGGPQVLKVTQGPPGFTTKEMSSFQPNNISGFEFPLGDKKQVGTQYSLTTKGGYIGYGGFPGLIIPWIKRDKIYENVSIEQIPQKKIEIVSTPGPIDISGTPQITLGAEEETPGPSPGGGETTALEGSFLWKDIQGSFNQGVSSRVPSFNYQYPTTFNVPTMSGEVSLDKNLNIEDLRKSQAPDWYSRLQELQKKGEGALQTTVGAIKEFSSDIFNLGKTPERNITNITPVPGGINNEFNISSKIGSLAQEKNITFKQVPEGTLGEGISGLYTSPTKKGSYEISLTSPSSDYVKYHEFYHALTDPRWRREEPSASQIYNPTEFYPNTDVDTAKEKYMKSYNIKPEDAFTIEVTKYPNNMVEVYSYKPEIVKLGLTKKEIEGISEMTKQGIQYQPKEVLANKFAEYVINPKEFIKRNPELGKVYSSELNISMDSFSLASLESPFKPTPKNIIQTTVGAIREVSGDVFNLGKGVGKGITQIPAIAWSGVAPWVGTTIQRTGENLGILEKKPAGTSTFPAKYTVVNNEIYERVPGTTGQGTYIPTGKTLSPEVMKVWQASLNAGARTVNAIDWVTFDLLQNTPEPQNKQWTSSVRQALGLDQPSPSSYYYPRPMSGGSFSGGGIDLSTIEGFPKTASKSPITKSTIFEYRPPAPEFKEKGTMSIEDFRKYVGAPPLQKAPELNYLGLGGGGVYEEYKGKVTRPMYDIFQGTEEEKRAQLFAVGLALTAGTSGLQSLGALSTGGTSFGYPTGTLLGVEGRAITKIGFPGAYYYITSQTMGPLIKERISEEASRRQMTSEKPGTIFASAVTKGFSDTFIPTSNLEFAKSYGFIKGMEALPRVASETITWGAFNIPGTYQFVTGKTPEEKAAGVVMAGPGLIFGARDIAEVAKGQYAKYFKQPVLGFPTENIQVIDFKAPKKEVDIPQKVEAVNAAEIKLRQAKAMNEVPVLQLSIGGLKNPVDLKAESLRLKQKKADAILSARIELTNAETDLLLAKKEESQREPTTFAIIPSREAMTEFKAGSSLNKMLFDVIKEGDTPILLKPEKEMKLPAVSGLHKIGIEIAKEEGDIAGGSYSLKAQLKKSRDYRDLDIISFTPEKTANRIRDEKGIDYEIRQISTGDNIYYFKQGKQELEIVPASVYKDVVPTVDVFGLKTRMVDGLNVLDAETILETKTLSVLKTQKREKSLQDIEFITGFTKGELTKPPLSAYGYTPGEQMQMLGKETILTSSSVGFADTFGTFKIIKKPKQEGVESLFFLTQPIPRPFKMVKEITKRLTPEEYARYLESEGKITFFKGVTLAPNLLGSYGTPLGGREPPMIRISKELVKTAERYNPKEFQILSEIKNLEVSTLYIKAKKQIEAREIRGEGKALETINKIVKIGKPGSNELIKELANSLLNRAMATEGIQQTTAHELIHYKTFNEPLWSPLGIASSIIDPFLPYSLRVSEQLAFGLEGKYAREGFPVRATTLVELQSLPAFRETRLFLKSGERAQPTYSREKPQVLIEWNKRIENIPNELKPLLETWRKVDPEFKRRDIKEAQAFIKPYTEFVQTQPGKAYALFHTSELQTGYAEGTLIRIKPVNALSKALASIDINLQETSFAMTPPGRIFPKKVNVFYIESRAPKTPEEFAEVKQLAEIRKQLREEQLSAKVGVKKIEGEPFDLGNLFSSEMITVYHGTDKLSAEKIKQEGLKPGSWVTTSKTRAIDSAEKGIIIKGKEEIFGEVLEFKIPKKLLEKSFTYGELKEKFKLKEAVPAESFQERKPWNKKAQIELFTKEEPKVIDITREKVKERKTEMSEADIRNFLKDISKKYGIDYFQVEGLSSATPSMRRNEPVKEVVLSIFPKVSQEEIVRTQDIPQRDISFVREVRIEREPSRLPESPRDIRTPGDVRIVRDVREVRTDRTPREPIIPRVPEGPREPRIPREPRTPREPTPREPREFRVTPRIPEPKPTRGGGGILLLPIGERERKKKEKKKLVSGYDVYIRRKKIYQKESPFALPREEALTYGARKVISSAAATFQLRTSKEEAKSLGLGPSPPELSKMFRAPKKLERPETYVQKERQRITTFGEKKEISFKGIEARKGIPATNYLKSKASKSRRSFFK